MKKIITALLTLAMVFSLAACGSSEEKADESKGADSAPAAVTKTATGGVVTAELPEGWKLLTGAEAYSSSDYDFIYTSDAIDASYFSVFHDTQDVEHYKDMIATGNYGKDLGTAQLGEGTWYIAEKVAAGPIGEDCCVIQAYDCDLSNAELQAVLASLKWAK